MNFKALINFETLTSYRKAFSTQFVENENIEKNAILGVDLDDIDSDRKCLS